MPSKAGCSTTLTGHAPLPARPVPPPAATRALQGRQADAEVVEDRLAEHGEGADDAEGGRSRLPCGPPALTRAQVAREREEDGYDARRVHDDEQGDERFTEQLPRHATPSRGNSRPAAAAACRPRSRRRSYSAGSVVLTPNA